MFQAQWPTNIIVYFVHFVIIILNIGILIVNKAPFFKEKALKSATVSNQIEGYVPVKDKKILKKIKENLSLIKLI